MVISKHLLHKQLDYVIIKLVILSHSRFVMKDKASGKVFLEPLQRDSSIDKSWVDKLAVDKAALEMDRINQVKFNNDLFFNLMLQALRQVDHSQELLIKAAKQVGYNSLSEALNKIQNSDGQSPLQYCIQKQDFVNATRLMEYGATAGPIEKAVLDIASDSKAGRAFGLTPPPRDAKLHPVKNFGLVLGLEMTSKDGTYSQYAHIGPTYQLMTEAIGTYSQKNPVNKEFKEIAEAFDFSNRSAAFSNSTSQRNPKAGAEIASRIQSGKTTTIPINCDGHAMGLSVVPDGPGSKTGYLIYTNRGIGAKPDEYGTQIYRLNDINNVNPPFINSVMNGLSNGSSHDEIKSQIAQVTGGNEPIHTIKQKGQKVDNCTIANSSSNIHGILLCQEAVKKGGFENLVDADKAAVRKEYKKFKADMKADKVSELVDSIKKNPEDSDLINLGKKFVNKPNVDAGLKAQVEKVLASSVSQESKNQQRPFSP